MRNYLLYIVACCVWMFCLLVVFFTNKPMYSMILFVLTPILVYYGTVFFLSLESGDPPDEMVQKSQKETTRDRVLGYVFVIGFFSFVGFVFYKHSVIATKSYDKNLPTQILYLVLSLLFTIGLPLWLAHSKLSKKENTEALTD